MLKILRAAKNSAFKYHPRDISRNEIHLYRIVLVHIIYNIAVNIPKHLQVARYRILKIAKTQILDSLPHYLITVAKLKAKQSSTRPPFYAKITNSPVGCAFWGSDECRPSVPCLFFYLQSGCLSSSSSRNHIKVLIFHINTFFQQHI